jgi:hypothetical protein
MPAEESSANADDLESCATRTLGAPEPNVGFVIFLNQACFEQSLEGPVQRAGTQPDATTGLLFDLAHDGISMQVVTGECEEKMEGDRRQGASLRRGIAFNDTSFNDY